MRISHDRLLIWFQGLACGGFVVLAPVTAIVLTALLAPGLVAMVVDRQPTRPVARAVLLCGSAACVEPMLNLWRLGTTDTSVAWSLLRDPTVLSMAWGAAGAGWLLTQVLPLAARLLMDARSLTRAARLRAERDRLAKAWGLTDQ